MATSSPMHEHVHARFDEVFGKSDNTLGVDAHWSLNPAQFKHAINIVVNGSAEAPAVWVFDPNVEHDSVLRIAIETMNEVEAIIIKIKERLTQVHL